MINLFAGTLKQVHLLTEPQDNYCICPCLFFLPFSLDQLEHDISFSSIEMHVHSMTFK